MQTGQEEKALQQYHNSAASPEKNSTAPPEKNSTAPPEKNSSFALPEPKSAGVMYVSDFEAVLRSGRRI